MHEDAIRWNTRYRQEKPAWSASPRSLLVQFSSLLPQYGRALDIAMGQGANSEFLSRRGWIVFGVDISIEAVRIAKSVNKDLRAFVTDVPLTSFQPSSFDVILNFYYLDRPTLRKIAGWLRPAGLVFIETLTVEMLAMKPELDRNFLLESGELLTIFSGWEQIHYNESWVESDHGRRKAIASLVARLPDSRKETP